MSKNYEPSSAHKHASTDSTQPLHNTQCAKKKKRSLEQKFAILKTVGDDITLLGVLGDNKEAALEYGAKVAETNKEGNISCVLGYFNEHGGMCVNMYRIYDVWPSDEKSKEIIREATNWYKNYIKEHYGME